MVNCIPCSHKREKKSWKVVENKEILKLYSEVVNQACEHGLLYCQEEAPILRYTRRTKNLFAYCNMWRVNKNTFECAIVLGETLLHLPADIVRETLCHELAHAINSPYERHGSEWERCARLIGSKWGYRPQQYATDKEVEEYNVAYKALHPSSEYKYQLVCLNCGKEFTKYKSMCESLQRRKYACPHCHIPLGYKVLETGEVKEIPSKR